MTRYRDTALPDLIDAARSEVESEVEDAFGEIVRRFRANAQASAFRMLRDTDLAAADYSIQLDGHLGQQASGRRTRARDYSKIRPQM